ncbi:MAG: class I adenylate-forming enzyme family protein [Acidimicrobiia bacterium]|jgi:acyl-CoA synthetase (AMP-forming)/AMP-acid ligase II
MTDLADLLADSDASPDEALVHWRGRAYSRAEISDAADALAEQLRRAGVAADSAVSALVPSTPIGVVMLFGIWRAGAVCAPLNPRLPEAELERLIADVKPSVVVKPSNDEESLIPQVVARAGEPRQYDDAVALVMTTSGTTGPPKRVLLEHESVLASVDSALNKIRGGATRDPDAPRRTPMPNLVPMPLALWAGIYNTLFAARVGAAVILLHPFSTTEFAAAVREFQLKSTVLAPPMITMLVDDLSITHLEPLRFVRSGTAPLSPREARRFRDRFGVTVLNSYGQTELGGEIVGWDADDVKRHGDAKLGSVGRPHEGIEVRIVREDGTDAAVDEPGEIWARSPFVMRGYASDQRELDTRLDEKGFLRTGDIGHLDPDGFLWIDGRVSDAINRGGLKIYPADVEEVLRADPAVADVCVAGVPDRRVGEVPWAWIVVAPGATLDPDALAARCRERLAPYAVPARFEAVEALPRNDVGKVLRRELVEPATAALIEAGEVEA